MIEPARPSPAEFLGSFVRAGLAQLGSPARAEPVITEKTVALGPSLVAAPSDFGVTLYRTWPDRPTQFLAFSPDYPLIADAMVVAWATDAVEHRPRGTAP